MPNDYPRALTDEERFYMAMILKDAAAIFKNGGPPGGDKPVELVEQFHDNRPAERCSFTTLTQTSLNDGKTRIVLKVSFTFVGMHNLP